MNSEVYILTILKETPERFPEVQASAHRNMDSALKAYEVAVDEARAESEDYEFAHEDAEICTDTYRWYRISDLEGVHAITIEIQLRSIIGEEEYKDMGW